jgi:hypothetical protein
VRAPDDVDRLSSVFRGVLVLGCSFWLDVGCAHFLPELSPGGACGAAPAASAKVVMPIVSAILTTRCMAVAPFAIAVEMWSRRRVQAMCLGNSIVLRRPG